MNKMNGFIDPVSLSFIVVLSIATVGSISDENAIDQEQMAQESPAQIELAVSPQEDPKT